MLKKTILRIGLSAVLLLTAGCGGYASSPYPKKETRLEDSEARRLARIGPPTARDADWYKPRLAKGEDGRQIKIWYHKQQRFPNERYLAAIMYPGVGMLVCLVDSGTDEHRLIARTPSLAACHLTQDMRYALASIHLREKGGLRRHMWLVRLADRRAVQVLATDTGNDVFRMSLDERRLVCIIRRHEGHSFAEIFLGGEDDDKSVYHRRCEVDLTQAYADLDGPKAVDIQNIFGGEWHAPPFPVIEAPAPPPTPETPEATAAP